MYCKRGDVVWAKMSIKCKTLNVNQEFILVNSEQ